MIYTGGISITDKEIGYVNDALINGWDGNHDGYIKKFEEEFARYVGVKYARAVSGGTQALLLSLVTLDIGPGDEVILPNLTYFACSDVIKECGASPVFVDVDKYNWCIDPIHIKSYITPKTKAIMPVWLYGNGPQMDQILEIALKYNLYIIEDACPAVGSSFNNKSAGSFGDFGCFSFHGSKIMTTGFGGMVVTNNSDLYEKLLWINNHGEDTRLPYRFWQNRLGYSFDLSNISCAMGLAQLERIQEFIDRKREIFSWYKKYLPLDLNINQELPEVFSNMWMTSIVLDEKTSIKRDNLIKNMRKYNIDTRPFFFPISSFPMYLDVPAYTPNSYYLSRNGLNLPSGFQRTEEDIYMICETIRELL